MSCFLDRAAVYCCGWSEDARHTIRPEITNNRTRTMKGMLEPLKLAVESIRNRVRSIGRAERSVEIAGRITAAVETGEISKELLYDAAEQLLECATADIHRAEHGSCTT